MLRIHEGNVVSLPIRTDLEQFTTRTHLPPCPCCGAKEWICYKQDDVAVCFYMDTLPRTEERLIDSDGLGVMVPILAEDAPMEDPAYNVVFDDIYVGALAVDECLACGATFGPRHPDPENDDD